MAEQSITGFLNPVLNIPLQEQFESLEKYYTNYVRGRFIE